MTGFPFYDYDSDFFSTEDLLFLAGASGKAVEDTATGNPLTFTTDLAKPLKSLLIPFTPVQSGTGDPSPQNVRPILPWNGLKVWNGGKNLFNKNDPNCLQDKLIYGDGTIGDSQYSQTVTGFIPVIPGEKLMISHNINANYYSCFYDASGNPVKYIVGSNFAFTNTYFPVTVPNGAVNIRITFSEYNFDN